jgi:hypothetical protein
VESQNDALALFHNLCGFSFSLNEMESTDMQAEYPNSGEYLAGMSITLVHGDGAVYEVPADAKVELKFALPSDLGKTVTGFFWDTSANNGKGAWVETPVVMVDGYAVLTAEYSGAYVLIMK